MGFLIGTISPFGISTWAKLRCPLIKERDQVEVYENNLIIKAGFKPEQGRFLRVRRWPGFSFWLDINSQPHLEQDGPIVGWSNNAGESDSFFSIGAYDASYNQENNPSYTSVNNMLDEKHTQESLVGLQVTYSSGTFVTTTDALNYPASTFPWYGQNIGPVTITDVSSIDTFIPF
jgi:hypothetical protein